MLTYIVNATSAGDDVSISGDVITGTSIVVNTQSFNTHDSSVIINCGDGNDFIEMDTEATGTSITVRGGLGDDRLTVGQGNIGGDISGGHITFEENPNEGTDGVWIDDAAGEVHSQHDTMHISNTSTYVDETLAIDATVFYSDNVESKFILQGGPDDVDYIDGIPSGLNVQLGLGDNTVIYGGSNHVMFGTIFPATLSTSNQGSDTIIFNDQNGSGTGRLMNRLQRPCSIRRSRDLIMSSSTVETPIA